VLDGDKGQEAKAMQAKVNEVCQGREGWLFLKTWLRKINKMTFDFRLPCL
jgi:hypothetical protein